MKPVSIIFGTRTGSHVVRFVDYSLVSEGDVLNAQQSQHIIIMRALFLVFNYILTTNLSFITLLLLKDFFNCRDTLIF